MPLALSPVLQLAQAVAVEALLAQRCLPSPQDPRPAPLAQRY
jgi:hypothetical protein